MGYYRGDPGFFSVLGSLGRSLGSAAVSMIPGVGGSLAKVVDKIPVGLKSAMRMGGSAIIKHPVLSGAGAAAAIAVGGAEAGRMGVFGRSAGKHPSKRHLHALAMGLRRARPRMNATNVHALRRAIRRTSSFARLAMKVIHITHPKKKGRFGGFKRRRKK